MESYTPKQQVTPVQNIPQEQIDGPSKTNQRGFIPLILGVVIFLIVVAGGAYYFGRSQAPKSQIQNSEVPSQSPQSTTKFNSLVPTGVDETTNWKTYINDTYKYTLKIPSDWIIDSDNAKQNDNKLIFIYSGDFKVIGDTQVPHLSKGSQLEILSNFAADVTKSYIDFITFIKPDGKEYPNEGKEITIDGERAMLWTSNNAFSIPEQKGYQASVLHHGEGYSMYMISALAQDTLFNRILSTFKFTD